jgi:hypothetical protein
MGQLIFGFTIEVAFREVSLRGANSSLACHGHVNRVDLNRFDWNKKASPGFCCDLFSTQESF